MKKWKKIALFRPLNLGNMLAATPLLRALRSHLPSSQIDLIALPWMKGWEKRFDTIDNIIPFPGYPGLPEINPDIKKIPGFIKKMQKEKYDLIIQAHSNGLITNPLIEVFAANELAGFYTKFSYKPKGTFIPYPEKVHEIKKLKKITDALGIPSKKELEFPIMTVDVQNKLKLQKKYSLKKSRYIIIHTGASDLKRSWEKDKFAELSDNLLDTGFDIVLTGSIEEKNRNKSIKKLMKSTPIDLTGITDIGTLATLLEDAALLVSNNSGVFQLAQSTHTPSVTLFSLYTELNKWDSKNMKIHSLLFQRDTSQLDVLSHIYKQLQRNVSKYKTPNFEKNANHKIQNS